MVKFLKAIFNFFFVRPELLIKRLLLLAVVFLLLCQAWYFLNVCWLIEHNPQTTAFMKQRIAAIHEKNPDGKLHHRWVGYDHISNHLKRAVVASEDSKFMIHRGFDWKGIEHAFKRNMKKGKIVGGGSTISQQLAKNLFLSSSRTPWRKLQEAVITYMIEKMLDKRRILEIYLNVIEWGNGVFGAEAAARHYYHVSAGSLSRYQAAKLAAMVPNPRFYDKNRNTRYLKRHTATVAARMKLVKIPKGK